MSEDKWEVYEKIVDKMCSVMSDEEIGSKCIDDLAETSQWIARNFITDAYNEKAADCMSLFKYMTDATISMMLISKRADKEELHDLIEHSVLEDLMKKYDIK